MRQIFDSEAFKTLDGKSKINELIEQDKESLLKEAVNKILVENINKLELGPDMQLGNEIELNLLKEGVEMMPQTEIE